VHQVFEEKNVNRFQGTVARPIHIVGVGLHTNKLVSIEILPASPDTGIVFQRIDIEAAPIPALPPYILSTQLCTTIGLDAHNTVATIEHLMAAFYGLGIDNALVLVDNVEIPILDGSSAPFVDRLSECGVQIQNVPRRQITIDTPIEVAIGDQYIRYFPPKTAFERSRLSVSCSIAFASPVIGFQNLSIDVGRESFMAIAEARTFCHIAQVEHMRRHGLALGGSLDNAVVIDDERVLNVDGLRFDNEFVRHKILDFLGDLALLPGEIAGRVVIHKGGHGLHALFTNRIYRDFLIQAPTSDAVAEKLVAGAGA
jgi:UDP-3-O-[3-hydroxymyristoyl] N-acetylglucosamine deacetylase